MAMSFSRPDPSSPASVADAAFGTGRRGFDRAEVRDFLRMVAAELGRLQERERFLERELRSAQSSPDLSSARLDDEALTRLLGEETARVLQTARESANQIKEKAEGAAGRLLAEASDEARRLREEAEVESTRRRADAASDAEAELDMAKQQGREMVNEARAYRERVLSELARRRELAREQIEQLIHGRDRLMQSFERARLVAVDIVSEMQPLGEPDEYVNLEPTTGPVPVMVANAARPDDTLPQIAETDAAEAEKSDDGAPTRHRPPTTPARPKRSWTTPMPAIPSTRRRPMASSSMPSATTMTMPIPMSTPERSTKQKSTRNRRQIGAAETDAADMGDSAVDEAGAGDEPDSADTSDDSATDTATDSLDDTFDDTSDDGSDDVVVDLFARLRADATPTDGDDTDGDADAVVESVGDSIWGHTDDVTAQTTLESAAESTSDPVEVPEPTSFERRDEDLTPLIVGSARKLKRVLADEQNGVLDALRRHHPVRDLDDLLPAADEHAARYGDAIADDLLLAAQAGANSVATGRAAKLSKSAASDATSVAADVLDHWLVAPLRDRLATVRLRRRRRQRRDHEEGARRLPGVEDPAHRRATRRRVDRAHGRGVLGAIDGDDGHLGRRRAPRRVRRLRRQRPRWRGRGRRRIPHGRHVRAGPSRLPLHVAPGWPVISAPMRRANDLPVDARRRRIGGRGILIVLGGLFLFVLIFGRAIARFYVDFLWHRSLGRSDVFWGVITAKLTLFVAFFLIFAIIAAANLFVADRTAPSSFPANMHPYVERFHELFGRRLKLVRYGVAVMFALLLALPAVARWQRLAAVPQRQAVRCRRRAVRRGRRLLRVPAAVPDVPARLVVHRRHHRAAVDRGRSHPQRRGGVRLAGAR